MTEGAGGILAPSMLEMWVFVLMRTPGFEHADCQSAIRLIRVRRRNVAAGALEFNLYANAMSARP